MNPACDTHRPCSKCGVTIGRNPMNPLLCLFCASPIPPRFTYTVHTGQGQADEQLTRAQAVPLMRAGRQHTTQARCVITAHCDCGWDTPAYPTWTGLDADLAAHRAAHRTGRCPAHLLDLIMEDI